MRKPKSEKVLARIAASRARGAAHLGRPYSDEENRTLRELRKLNMKASEIAARLPGRTPQSVRHQILKLGLPPLPEGALARIYTPEKAREAVLLYDGGMILDGILAKLGGKSKGGLSIAIRKAREAEARERAAEEAKKAERAAKRAARKAAPQEHRA